MKTQSDFEWEFHPISLYFLLKTKVHLKQEMVYWVGNTVGMSLHEDNLISIYGIYLPHLWATCIFAILIKLCYREFWHLNYAKSKFCSIQNYSHLRWDLCYYTRKSLPPFNRWKYVTVGKTPAKLWTIQILLGEEGGKANHIANKEILRWGLIWYSLKLSPYK